MRYKVRRRREAEGDPLRFRRFNKLGRGDEHARYPARFQITDVMHTARRTGSSISERFDHHVAVARDLKFEIGGRYSRERRLLVTPNRDAARA